ncbi:MAG: hypothetical protein IKN73_00790 [Alphaproteobacteria bacterium]|nr:hypothetical protein [Alphaproteobacteria bacterium]
MIKKWLIEKGLKFLFIAIVIGIGISYLSSSIGGASLSYTSVDQFLKQIGVQDGDISTTNGCFLCTYMYDLFAVIGNTTQMFWEKLVKYLWVVMVIGFGIFVVMHTLKQINEAANSKDIKDLTSSEPKLEFGKWFEKVWKTAVRVLIAAAFLGAINWTGASVLKTTTQLVVSPVMYIGTTLSTIATNRISNIKCDMLEIKEDNSDMSDILNPVLKPFMCVIGNLNTVMLAGAAGGFALMNYSWLGMGGGLFTWLSGLALVIIFLIIGFDLLFQVLNVLFKLIFIIIFMPLLIAAAAFEEVWGISKGLMNSAIDILIKSAISILKISLKITIIYAIVFFASDSFYPGPHDGFTSIMPPLLGEIYDKNPDAQTMSVMKVFTTCEQTSITDGEIDKSKFLSCFNAQKTYVESRYPGAFDFMDDGFDFFIFMIGIGLLYFWVLSPKIDTLLNTSKDEKETFNYGDWLKDAAKQVYNKPMQLYDKIYDKMQGK